MSSSTPRANNDLSDALSARRQRARRAGIRPLYWSLGTDILIAISVIATLMFLYLPELQAPLMRARLTQVFTLVQQVRHDQIVEHAVRGRWPAALPEDAVQMNNGVRVANALFADGHFSLELDLPDGAGRLDLSFRRAENASLGTRFWYCGGASPDPLAAVTIPDITDIPAAWLPPSCRPHR